METLIFWLPDKIQAVIFRLFLAIVAEAIFFYGLFTEQARFCIFAFVMLAMFIILEFAGGGYSDK